MRKAYEDPDLSPKRTVHVWEPRDRERAPSRKTPAWAEALGAVFAFLAEFGLWILGAILLGVVLLNARRWLPWFGEQLRARPTPSPVTLGEAASTEPLPDDPVAAVRALSQAGKPRAALALLYRASVHRLADALDSELPAGATESVCLRHARRLPRSTARGWFTDVVRHWQAAAYAGRLPRGDEIEALLDAWPAAWESAT